MYITGVFIAVDMDYLKILGAGAVTLGAVTTATAVYLSQKPHPIPMVVDMLDQTAEVPGKDRARISRYCKNGKLVEYLDKDVRTLYEAFRNGARLSSNGQALGWKPGPKEPYKWLSYNDTLVKAANLGAGLIHLGEMPVNTTNIGIYSQNRPEYVILEQACYMYSMVIVPLYDTLGEEACTFIINQAEIQTVVCDKNVKVLKLLQKREQTPNLKLVIVMEETTGEVENLAKQTGVKLLHYDTVEKLGEDNPQEPRPAKPSDRCVICYTSGTTGLPKGAILTHSSIISIDAGGLTLNPADRMISYLPLAHSYERLIEVSVYMGGGGIGFFQGDVRKLMDDIQELKPTVFASVPRLLNRFYDKVTAGVNASSVKKMLFSIAMREKEKELRRGIVRKDSIWDKFVFQKIQAGLGGRVRLITTGSAPLSPKVLSFLRCCVGCPILEGYGQTESSAIISLQLPGEPEVGNVGPPLACNYVKLVDVREMDYWAADGRGEICLKGPNLFGGYLKDPEKTKEVLDEEGWLHTGDIGAWCPNGTLKIIDRKKHIFKLAQGEYIAPEKIENVYVRSPLVCQVFIYGESLKATLVGVAVPDPDTLPGFAKKQLGLSGSVEDLARNPIVKEAIMESLMETAKKGGLASFEQMRDVYVYPEMFSVENGLLTPTFKAKRHELQKYFKPQIDAMYTKLQ
ncbi:hypothetical protein ScPMuIL_004160 [Solemya velum]